MEKILLIDDDEDLCELVGEYLTVENFAVEAVHDGASGLERAKSGGFDLVTLDVMMPKMDGFEVLKNLRRTSQVPVLMLTARGDDAERIVGLDAGADDYLPKPFNPRELVARIRAILRRVKSSEENEPNAAPEKLQIDDVEISPAARSAKCGGEELNLTAVEFDLLAALLKEAGNIVKKEDLSLTVLDRKLSPYDRSLDMHVSNLRKKLGTRGEEERIKTIRSVGYIYTVSG